MIIRVTKPVTLHILYYPPDYTHVLQEFVWSFDDLVPELHRTHKFLWHWKHNITAVIAEIRMGIGDRHVHTYTHVDQILNMN